MELNEFATLIACGSTNTAKNTMSYLIGNGQNNSNWNKALAELYKAFPTNIKTSQDSRKEFFPIILKYFENYVITKDNIDIYKEYEELFSAKNKDDLKKKNPQWQWDEEPEVIFKNALAFSNALPNNYQAKRFDFIKQYEKQFAIFAQTQKDKILKHFTSRRIWDGLMKEDYLKFVEFCDKYNFDRIAILKETITSYTNLYSHSIFESEHVNYYFDDLMQVGKEHLKIINDFYPQSGWYITNKNNNHSVFNVILEAIGNNQYKSAMKWIFIFDKELTNYAKLYEVDNLHNSENFKKVLKEQIKILKDRNSSYGVSPNTLEKVLDNHNWFKFMDNFELFDNLSNKLEPKQIKTKPTKI